MDEMARNGPRVTNAASKKPNNACKKSCVAHFGGPPTPLKDIPKWNDESFDRHLVGDFRMLEVEPTHNKSKRSGTVSAFAASDGIFSFAIACPSGSAFRFVLASLAGRRRR
jgi:hypothetical protein